MPNRKRVCFVSDENTCRSIIAEVYLRHLARQHFEVQSFGLKANRVHYLVKRALSNRDLNPNYSFSKVYDVIENQKFDMIVLMHPNLKDKLPKIGYEYELITWEINKVRLDNPVEDQLKKDLESLCENIEKNINEFIKLHHND